MKICSNENSRFLTSAAAPSIRHFNYHRLFPGSKYVVIYTKKDSLPQLLAQRHPTVRGSFV